MEVEGLEVGINIDSGNMEGHGNGEFNYIDDS